MIFVGTNYHPHDWPKERWPADIRLMKEAGFTHVRLGHLCWDSFEPSEGNYTFNWFDEAMNLFAEAGIKVVLDIATRPAPTWLHKKDPSIDLTDRNGNRLQAVHRYMDDVGNGTFQECAFRFAETLTKRYADHPALYAFGLCNEVGSGAPSYSEEARKRYVEWLREKYKEIECLNEAWAAQRWSRRLNSFEDAEFPVAGSINGAPERILDMWRFFSDEQLAYLNELSVIVKRNAPNARESTNHWGEHPGYGFDYLKGYKQIFDLPGVGFYPGVNPEDRNALFGACFAMSHRIGESEKPMWCLEFQTGSFGAYAPPKGVLRMYAYLSLLFRAEAIFAWTWRSMLGGEEQYFFGLLDHDGQPGRKWYEYQQFASEIKGLEIAGELPYLPQPEIALAYSFEAFKVSENQKAYYKTPYLRQVMQVFETLIDENIDCNVVNLRNIDLNYKVLLIPGHAIMDEASAQSVRKFVEKGGTVIMTAYSAKVDENNRVFGTTLPGRLSEVFGIRANAFERPVAHHSDANEGGLQKTRLNLRRESPRIVMGERTFEEPIDYYEILEPSTAEILGVFSNLEQELPAVTANTYGLGTAIYVAIPAQKELMQALITDCSERLGSRKGPVTPHGVVARQIGNAIFYVNTTPEEKRIELDGRGYGLLSGQPYESTLTLRAYDIEVVREDTLI
ncbi:beta-galactosidase [Paenibacillus sinopodophylli]|uniref:beta-galactosidase n=1 Tax=Paenibacillus sinopodophylli TaxID=1837342 RepID=UPI00110D14B4|nr:beta-galactosidase [Paenibacillus sinopodophylli]